MAWIRSNKKGGGSAIPQLVSFQVRNDSTPGTLSYTFAENGTFQYIGVHKYGEVGILPETMSFKLNGETITPTVVTNAAYVFFYGEISVSSGDVLTMTSSVNDNNSGMQLQVFENANISVFRVIGFCGNDDNTFDITNSAISIEVYWQGYYNGNNNSRYHLIAGNARSIPTAGGSPTYYWGGTYALQLL